MTTPAPLHVVLVEPEIPPNTGNVARLCSATRCTLHLIEPFGFRLDDATLRRAGMDYWKQVEWRRWDSWAAYRASMAAGATAWFIEEGGPRRHDEARFRAGDSLVFGRETAGLPKALLEAHAGQWLRIPMFNPAARSLNLSNCVAVVVYEAMRQFGFAGEVPG